jgi:hypothetical protein
LDTKDNTVIFLSLKGSHSNLLMVKETILKLVLSGSNPYSFEP